jgi:hypothetical protein
MAICFPTRDWALALAREAVIRPLTDRPIAQSPNQSEVTEKLVVTASDELSISRRLGLPARRKTPDGSDLGSRMEAERMRPSNIAVAFRFGY